MASNFFGQIFRITTFGESHGPAIGVVIDGCPAGLPISKEEIEEDLKRRRPGNPHTSPRKETDEVEILSGIYQGITTGAPIALLIQNKDANSNAYASIQNLYRPGHANFTYLEKYGIFDDRGGGRASARETAARVAAGSIAKKLLQIHHISCTAFVSQIGNISISLNSIDLASLQQKTYESPLFCPDPEITLAMQKKLKEIQEENDSIGGIVSCIAKLPSGLGDPIYQKLEALLGYAMLSIPATKGFEIGSGFSSCTMKGSEHNDLFEIDSQKKITTKTNFAGGTLGGISTGSPLIFRVAFKPTSSIKKPQETLSLDKKKSTLDLGPPARHDPCVAIRGASVVEAMTALVLADALLMNQNARI